MCVFVDDSYSKRVTICLRQVGQHRDAGVGPSAVVVTIATKEWEIHFSEKNDKKTTNLV
jgi:hypothetical protein